MVQWHKYLPRPPYRRDHVLVHNRIVAREVPLIPQPLEHPPRRVTLLQGHAAIPIKQGINPRELRPKLLLCGTLAPPVVRSYGKPKDLADRILMNAKSCLCPLTAHTVNHHRTFDSAIWFHCEHPSNPAMPSSASNSPSRTGMPCRRLTTAPETGSVKHFEDDVQNSSIGVKI